jgi:nicotinamide mononucleotide transporter
MINSIVKNFGKWFGIEGVFASWFVILGILSQLVTCYIMNDSGLAVCSGIAGVVSVVLCSQKKLSFYFWGILQLVTILIISYQTGLYGKVLENGFYLITMLLGFLLWDKNKTDTDVKTETMGFSDYAILAVFTPLLVFGVSLFVVDTNSEQPFLDTLTTVIGIVAQIMLIFRFKEQWVLWFILDVLCIILWAIDGNWCLMTQYIFWTVNCIYGFFYWSYAKN